MAKQNDKDYKKGFGTALFGYNRSDVNKYIIKTDKEYKANIDKMYGELEELRKRIAAYEKKDIAAGLKKSMTQSKPIEEPIDADLTVAKPLDVEVNEEGTPVENASDTPTEA